MTAADTARAFREGAKRRIAVRLTRARADHEVSQRDLAEAAGVSRALVTHWEDPEHSASPTLADIEAIARALPAIARDLLEATADELRLALVAVGPTDLDCDFAAIGETLTAAGELASHHHRAIRDDRIDASEAAEGLPLARRAKQAGAALEARYLEALEQRTVPVIRAGKGGK